MMTARHLRLLLAVIIATIESAVTRAEDWPTLHHDLQRTGRTGDQVSGPYLQAWMKSWDGEAITTRCEAIVAGGRVYVGTCAGRLHCLDAAGGDGLWTRELEGAVLHSPTVAEGVVYAASLGGVWALDAATGQDRWRCPPGPGGYCTSPTVAGGRVLIGGRDGVFRALDARSGELKWKRETGGPIRTTAAVDGDRVFFAADDMHAYAADVVTGEQLWKSERLHGQTLRDSYPVLAGGKVILRSNPAITFSDRIGADRSLLARNAGVDDSDWKKLDAYLKSERIFATPEQHAREQQAILAHLREDPHARTFFVLDAATGRQVADAPVLWVSGCGGVAAPPVVLADGRCIVCYRSAYGNFSLGVAPLVGLGYLDTGTGRIDPITHAGGKQPPWNTFWGTADECQSYSVGGDILYIAHQGTLSGLDLKARKLFPIAGNRDTYGGHPPPPWTRNEWHGPARGSAAIAGDTLYWITGSRVIAIRGTPK